MYVYNFLFFNQILFVLLIPFILHLEISRDCFWGPRIGGCGAPNILFTIRSLFCFSIYGYFLWTWRIFLRGLYADLCQNTAVTENEKRESPLAWKYNVMRSVDFHQVFIVFKFSQAPYFSSKHMEILITTINFHTCKIKCHWYHIILSDFEYIGWLISCISSLLTLLLLFNFFPRMNDTWTCLLNNY